MKDPIVQNLVDEANQLLDMAKEEMDRSEEDVVTHLVCKNSRLSMVKYMEAYLLEKGVKVRWPITPDKLLQQCRTLDERFNELDLSAVACRFDSEDDDYCLELDMAGHCYDLAEQAKSLIE
jgi:spore coat polysaccharide biosynthesis protein SpsF (cytidylyltransferase family)